MPLDTAVIHRFHSVLVDEIRREAPEYLEEPFTVAEIYQSLVPYRTHRDRIGVELNGDYEAALLRLLGGEGDLLALESDAARHRIQRELESSNPNTGVYREFAAVQVHLNPDEIPEAGAESAAEPNEPELAMPSGRDAGGGAGKPGSDSGSSDSSSEPKRPGPEPTGSKAAGPRAQIAAPNGQRKARGAPPSECPDCGSGLPDRDTLRFCPYCGANVFIMPCGDCGEVLERDWSYCIACGSATDD